MRLSYSKISTFLDCGFKFKLRYIHKLPQKPRSHLRLGSVLHSVLGKFYIDAEAGLPSLDYLLSLYEEAWPSPTENYQSQYDLGREILEEYYRSNMDSWRFPLWVESAFNVPLRGHTIVGVFDRVDSLEDGRTEIIDYKAQKILPTQEEIDEDLQLKVYALAFREITGNIPDLLSVYHLRSNRKWATSPSREEVDATESRMLEVAKEITYGRNFRPKANQKCRWCDYKTYCPLKATNPLPIPHEGADRQLSLQLNR